MPAAPCCWSRWWRRRRSAPAPSPSRPRAASAPSVHDGGAMKPPARKVDADEEGPPGLPPGTPFYMTPARRAARVEELRRLWSIERPKVVEVVSWAAGLGDRSENADYQYGKRRLREIDRRVRFLRKRLDAAELVDPQAPRAGRAATHVFFGATVTYATSTGTERTIRIVGVDETDLERNYISWIS